MKPKGWKGKRIQSDKLCENATYRQKSNSAKEMEPSRTVNENKKGTQSRNKQSTLCLRMPNKIAIPF